MCMRRHCQALCCHHSPQQPKVPSTCSSPKVWNQTRWGQPREAYKLHCCAYPWYGSNASTVEVLKQSGRPSLTSLPDVRRLPRSSINAESKRLHFPETFLHFNNTKLPPQKLRSLNVPIEHHPTIGFHEVYGLLDGYYFGWCPIYPSHGTLNNPSQKLRSAQQGRGRNHSKLPGFQAAKLRNHEGLRSGEILPWTAWTDCHNCHNCHSCRMVQISSDFFRFLQISSDHLGSPERAAARLPPKNHVSEKAVNMQKTFSRHVTSCHQTAHPKAYQSLPAVNEILC